MLIPETEFTLKDGRTALLRGPRDEDVPEVLRYLYLSSCETEFLLRYPEENDRYTEEGEKAFFREVNDSDCDAMILCFVDGKLAGNCRVNWNKRIKTRHRATVAIALLQEFWGLGIGTRMMEEMIRIAESNPEILQIELEFIEGNQRARALYEKMGFRICGIRPDAVRLKDGTLLNEYAMIRKVIR